MIEILFVCLFDIFRKVFALQLLSTDDSLPYEPKPLKFGGGKENKFDPKHDNRSSYSNRDGSYFDSVSISSISSSSSSSGSSTEDEGESTGQLADLLKSIVEVWLQFSNFCWSAVHK